MVFIFNCGGKTRSDRIITFLLDFITVFEHAHIFPSGEEIIESVEYCFSYDADDEGVDSVLTKLKRDFRKIGDFDFIDDSDWDKHSSGFGRINGSKGLFVWGENPNFGTLENVIMPMFESSIKGRILTEKARSAIKEMFDWELPIGVTSPESEKYQKAVMTVAGQKEKPGCSLTVILEQSGLITEEALKNSCITQEFVDFINILCSSG